MPGAPWRYEPGQLRTLQRRVRQWRARSGPAREVMFTQVHRPGEACQVDFTEVVSLRITILGELFAHLLCVFTLPFSNWQWATVCLSESLAALRRGIQAALFQLGGVPQFSQTDNSTSRKRVAASMARQGLVARPPRRWRRTTDSSHREPVAPNLLARNFTAEAPDRVWVGDTTYLPVLGGFLFLVVILDLFSRKVVGWSLGDRLDAELSTEALRRAIMRRQPGPGLLFHSYRGFEFAAKSFRDVLGQIGAVQSMSRKGNCWDNAVAESFFSTLEFEGPSTTTWRSVDDARPSLTTFIESYYNARRLHSRDGYRSPNETEHLWRSEALAA